MSEKAKAKVVVPDDVVVEGFRFENVDVEGGAGFVGCTFVRTADGGAALEVPDRSDGFVIRGCTFIGSREA